MKKRLLVSFFVGVFWIAALSHVHAAITASISPSGTLSQVSNVTVVFSYNFSNGAQAGMERIESFSVKYNGQDATQTFLNAATITLVSDTLVKAEIEYLFPPGTYTFTTAIKLQGEDPVSAETTFTVPGDEQTRRKNTVLSKISLFMHQWDERTFSQWISLGNLSTFSNRIFSNDVQVYVDPDYLSDTGAVAAYVEKYIWKYIWTVYDQDLLISAEPEDFSNSGSNSSGTLWHEMIHAVSHGLQVAGSSAQFSFSDDHLYIEWAESCIRGLRWLGSFEDYVASNGISNPTPQVASGARERWKKFVRDCNSTLYGTVPTDAQKNELKTVMGFDVDPETVKNGYLGLGYPPEYFDDITVQITSPSNGAEVAANQVDVNATISINEPGVTADKVGFIINGSVQYSTLSGNSFSTVAVLATGDNSIQAGLLTTDGRLFMSKPITVKSTAINNRYHIRITWDKDDTDVDLHFSWSGGSECYYGRKTPNWGSPETSPRLDVDDTNGYGPENITIEGLPGPGSYRIFIYYYSDHGNGGTNVSATIYENGAPIFSSSKHMTNHETWTLYELTL